MNILCTSRTRAFVAIAVLVGVSVLLLGSLAHGQTNDTLQVDYIDVGQGDSILLRASDGTDILIDGGLFQAGPTVVAHLQDKGIDDIDVMILTHADTDHVGGLIHVLSSTIPVESVLYNGQDNTSQDYLYFLTQAQRQGITPTLVQAGQSFTWGSINAVVLNPQATPGAGQNENSVTLLITYGEVRFLFTGDIGSDTEQTLLEGVAGTQTLRQWLPANVLKVAHHGSGGSSSAPFLEAVGAECAVISVGANNSYGHPAQETLDRLQAAGAQVLRTDQLGAITLTTDGQTIEGCTRTFVFLPLAMQQAHLAPAPRRQGMSSSRLSFTMASRAVKSQTSMWRFATTMPRLCSWAAGRCATSRATPLHSPALRCSQGRPAGSTRTSSIPSGAALVMETARPSGTTAGIAPGCAMARGSWLTTIATDALVSNPCEG